MEIIIGHNNTDFDCLASMLAARKLYPEAQLVLPVSIGREVREFINIYMDIFNFIEANEVDCEKLTRIIIVDTHSSSRIGKFSEYVKKPGIETIIYDHHILCVDEITSPIMRVEEVGANTTILVEEIIERGIELSPVEATIIALGIYVDTNSLIFSGTTYRDAYALAYLLEKEANLSVIESLVINRLSEGQQELSLLLNKNISVQSINGFEVGFSLVKMDYYVDDAAYLTRKILEERDLDAFFSIMRMKNKTYIIGRSVSEEIDLSVIMKLMGGGGHKGAGSSKSDEADLEKIQWELLEILKSNISPVLKVCDIMSSPVKTVPLDTTIDEAYDIMIRYGHSGMPVVSNDKIAGIISRRDIDKARVHGYGKSPVKGYMSKRVVTINYDQPIKEVQELFAEHDIGRLPVIKDNEIIGIVTRTDVIRTLYGGKYRKQNMPQSRRNEIGKEYTMENLSYKLDGLLPRVREVLALAGKIADEECVNIYVVGGFVRDLILGVENLDIDIVVEGNAIDFGRKFSKRSGAVFTEHEKFQTAYVVLEDDLKIDLVTARKEYYQFPGALPEIERGSIKDDLFRRDFTINCIAMKLNSSEFGKIVDFYGGRRDLYDGIIRILYNLSFVEDPTRIMRAIRFEQRYGFKMDEKTEDFAIDAINSGVLDKLSHERINSEFLYMLKEKNTLTMLLRMQELGLLEKIYPEIVLTEELKTLIENSDKHFEEFCSSLINRTIIDKILIYVLILFSNIPIDKVPLLADRLRLNKEYHDEVLAFVTVRDTKLPDLLEEREVTNYDIFRVFRGLSVESLYVITLMSSTLSTTRVKEAVLLYLNELSMIKPEITGKDILELGIGPGPEIKKILEIVRKEKINGKIFTRNDEIEFVRRNFTDKEI